MHALERKPSATSMSKTVEVERLLFVVSNSQKIRLLSCFLFAIRFMRLNPCCASYFKVRLIILAMFVLLQSLEKRLVTRSGLHVSRKPLGQLRPKML